MPSSQDDDKILELKRKALACKREGDIESAKTFLRQAKQLEQIAATSVSTNDESSSAQPKAQHHETLHSNHSQTNKDQAEHSIEDMKEDEEEEEQDDNMPRYEDPVNKAIDQANLEEIGDTNVRFTDNELIDFESMQDMREIMSEHFPTKAFYQERIMANKRAALEKKQANDIPAAKHRLMTAKQLENACTILFKDKSDKDDEDDDGEDYSLLDELFVDDKTRHQNNDDDGFFEQLFGKSATVLELDDLDDMDAALLKDMMEAGMQVPSVEEIQESAEERKIAAVAFKKDGNLDAAKAALLESKRLTSKANQLSSLLQVIASGVPQELDPELALGDMLKIDVETKKPPKSLSLEEATPKKDLLSSTAYREQAVKQKQLGNKDAAIAALRLYKEALALEEKARAAAQTKEWILALEKEAILASEQARRFVYYSQFVDKDDGSKFTSAWRIYEEACLSLAKSLGRGVESVSRPVQRRMENGLRRILDCDLAFVGESCDPSESRIEMSILELINLQSNKRLREQLGIVPVSDPDELVLTMPDVDSIRVVMSVQLPGNADAADDSVQTLTFNANSLRDGNRTYAFGPSQFIHAERGISRFAKQFARRLARRRCVAIEVFYLRVTVTKGLFSSSTKTEEILLGSAGLELTALQDKNFIAIDLPLVEARREVGGLVRLAIRSGMPFCETSNIIGGSVKEESAETTRVGQTCEMLESYAQLVIP